MLVLTRRTNEEIVIGDDIRVQVLEIIGGKVRLGVTAPADVTVHRLEVYDKIKQSTHPLNSIADPDAVTDRDVEEMRAMQSRVKDSPSF